MSEIHGIEQLEHVSQTRDYAVTTLASRMVARILWHLAKQEDTYAQELEKLPGATPDSNDFTASNMVLFQRVLHLKSNEIQHDIKTSLDELIDTLGNKDLASMGLQKKFYLSFEMHAYFDEIGHPVDQKAIFNILGEEVNIIAAQQSARRSNTR